MSCSSFFSEPHKVIMSIKVKEPTETCNTNISKLSNQALFSI